jgi:hypothetical protein
MSDIFPSILPERDFVDDSYSRKELERMEWAELRSVAAEHPKESVDGQTERATVIAELTGEQRV